MSTNIRDELLSLIQNALAGHEDMEAATRIMSKIGKSDAAELKEASHALLHFISDRDLRERDRDYDLSQRQQLKKNLLRFGGPGRQ